MPFRIQHMECVTTSSDYSCRLQSDFPKEVPVSPFVIGISGPSASGKSELTSRVEQQFPGCVTVLALDAYYQPLDKVKTLPYEHDNPKAVDLVSVQQHLQMLKQGKSVKSPIYDFTTHSASTQTKPLLPRPIVVVEGLYLFWDQQLRDELDHRIWLQADRSVLLRRRLARDVHPPRNRDKDEILHRFESHVWPAFEEYGAECGQHAHVSIVNDDEHFAKLAQALTDLMEHPRLQAVVPNSPGSASATQASQP